MNTFGRIFRISIFGEAHGPAIGVTIDGCPAGVPLAAEDLQQDLSRRRAGAPGTTTRREPDHPQILSGLFRGFTTGSPLTILIANVDVDSTPYDKIAHLPRPSHADLVAHHKFSGFNDYRGSGHFSGRLTACLVAAGAVAKKVIAPVHITASVTEAGGRTDIERAAAEAREKGDSIGGVVECVISRLSRGLGEPFFDSFESILSHAVFAIPAIKAIEFGSGFAASRMYGSQHNDPILSSDGKTSSNNAGGVNGGITNGNPVIFRVAVKPPSSIPLAQDTVDLKTGTQTTVQVTGRHDSCIALRVPPVIEAVAAFVIADLTLIDAATSAGHRGELPTHS